MTIQIIADIGSNYRTNEDLVFAAELAKMCHCDVFKIQYFDYDDLYFNAPQSTNHERIAKKDVNIELIAQICERHEIEFMASVFNPEDVEKLDPYVKRWKIPSCEAKDMALLDAVADTNKPVIVSTGAYADFHHLDFFPNKMTTIMYCVSEYPARNIDLKVLERYINEYDGINIGLSDHSAEYPNVALMARDRYGVTLFERHFNPIKFTKYQSPDADIFALTPGEMHTYCSDLKDLGRNIRVQHVNEDIIDVHRRRPIAIETIASGDRLEYGKNWLYKRIKPGMLRKEDQDVNDDIYFNEFQAKGVIRPGDVIDWDNIEFYSPQR